MTATAHSVAPEDIMAWLDGELSAAEAEAVTLHLDHCAECASLANGLRNTSQSLARWTVPAIPQDLENRIHGVTAGNKPNRDVSQTWRPWVLGGGGAVVAVTLAIIFATPRSDRSMALRVPQSAVVAPHAEKAEPVANGTVYNYAAPPQPPPPRAETSTVPSDTESDYVSSPTKPAVEAHLTAATATATAPMIAHSVSLTLQVKNVETARVSLDQILAHHHGYTAQLNADTAEDSARNLRASLRIPAPELAGALAEIKTLGRIQNESQAGEEVTQQHEDLAARLTTARGTEERLRAILQQRTGKISDVLEVEEEIARVRGEIEEMEAEQKTLEHRVDFATVDIQFTEDYKAPLNSSDNSALTRIHNAFVAGYRNATDTLLGFLLLFEEYGPTILIWLAILAVPIVLAWRRYRRLHANI